MNAAHYHLVLNHLPIIFPVVGILVLLGGFLFRLELIKRVAYAIFIMGAFLTIPAFQTGESAEEQIEHLAGVNEAAMEAHEDLAKTFAIFSYLLGTVSALALFLSIYKEQYSTLSGIVVLVFAAVTLFNAQKTGSSGGAIRHSEIGAQFSGGEGGENEGDEDND